MLSQVYRQQAENKDSLFHTKFHKMKHRCKSGHISRGAKPGCWALGAPQDPWGEKKKIIMLLFINTL